MTFDEKALLALAEQPLLNIAAENAKAVITSAFADQLRQGSLPAAALALGYRCESLSSAFFCGYQLAMRHLDDTLAADEFAAFAASEKGIKSSREFTSRLTTNNNDMLLNGVKSHVMLAHQGMLDCVYVLANNDEGELVCVKIKTNREGITPLASDKPQPFVKDVPHSPLSFNKVVCEQDFLLRNAHQQCFRPFRYWEDVMVGISFSGWMLRGCQSGELRQQLFDSVESLTAEYLTAPQYYTPASITSIEQTLATLSRCGKELPAQDKETWQQDSVLLMLGAVARSKVKEKLSI